MARYGKRSHYNKPKTAYDPRRRSEEKKEAKISLKRKQAIEIDLNLLVNSDPKSEYPQAMALERKFIIHVGGTNTGKTYQSLQRLKEAKSGFYLAPLRLLALEVQETLREQGVFCGLTTGEEEDLSPEDSHVASTVEKVMLGQRVDVVVIDECQMIQDPDRGFAWTRAILGCQAPEIHCCVAPEGLEILKEVISYCDCPYEVVEHQRLVPLRYLPKVVPLHKAQEGDAFITFSRRGVLKLAEELSDLGIPASVIYGALPYRARRKQMQRFLSGETKVLVATDAIGMGLNLPIQRVLFTGEEKFDGTAVRPLTVAEIKQIAGRAGRFGKYDEGFVGRTDKSILSIEGALVSEAEPVTVARLGYSNAVLDLDFPLAEVLKTWQDTPTPPPFHKSDVKRQVDLIELLKNRPVSKEDLLRLVTIPFNEENDELLSLFFHYTTCYTKGRSLEFPEFHPEFCRDLIYLELFSKKIDLYYSFCISFRQPYSKDNIASMKEALSNRINQHLIQQKKKVKKKRP